MNKELIHLKVNGAYFKINNNEANGLTWTTTTTSENSNDVTTWSTRLCESSEAKNHLKLLDALKHQSHLKLGKFYFYNGFIYIRIDFPNQLTQQKK